MSVSSQKALWAQDAAIALLVAHKRGAFVAYCLPVDLARQIAKEIWRMRYAEEWRECLACKRLCDNVDFAKHVWEVGAMDSYNAVEEVVNLRGIERELSDYHWEIRSLKESLACARAERDLMRHTMEAHMERKRTYY